MKKEPGNERHNDIELLKEICLEMPCEGKNASGHDTYGKTL